MLAPVPPQWRLERTLSTSAVTIKYDLSACLVGFTIHPEWASTEGVTLDHVLFTKFFSKWQFANITDQTGEYVTMVPRTSPLPGLDDASAPIAVFVSQTNDKFQQEKRLLARRIPTDNLDAFKLIIGTINLGLILYPVPLRGQLDQRHYDLLATLPDNGIEWIEKTDETGQVWTYLF